MEFNTKDIKIKKGFLANAIIKPKGYYYKGTFLSRYRTRAIEILREKLNKVGNLEKAKKLYPNIWAEIHKDYLRQKEITKKGQKKFKMKAKLKKEFKERIKEEIINSKEFWRVLFKGIEKAQKDFNW